MTRREEIKLLTRLIEVQREEEKEIKALKEELIRIADILGLKKEIVRAVHNIRIVK